MVRVYGLIGGYTPVKVHTPDGNKVKINIKTALLNPVGKNIVGTLHFNGTTAYIPKDSNLTIGSSPKCEIRINDSAVEAFHAMISSVGETVTVEHLLQSGKTAILSSAKEIKTIGAQDGPATLASEDKLVFALSGDKKLLAVDFKKRQPLAAEIQESLINQLQPRPPIEQVSVEEISAGQALASVEAAPLSLKSVVAGTPFAAARTIDEVIALYPDKLLRAKREDSLFNMVGTLGAVNSTAGLIYCLVTSGTSFETTLILGFALAFISTIYHTVFRGKEVHLNGALADVLSQFDPDEVTRALTQKTADEREKVLSVLERYNPTALKKDNLPAADAIRLRLPEALETIKNQSKSSALPPARVRVELPASVADSPVEEVLAAQEEIDSPLKGKS